MPYMAASEIKLEQIEYGLKSAYIQSRKLYGGNYEDIIYDYSNPLKK